MTLLCHRSTSSQRPLLDRETLSFLSFIPHINHGCIFGKFSFCYRDSNVQSSLLGPNVHFFLSSLLAPSMTLLHKKWHFNSMMMFMINVPRMNNTCFLIIGSTKHQYHDNCTTRRTLLNCIWRTERVVCTSVGFRYAMRWPVQHNAAHRTCSADGEFALMSCAVIFGC